MDAGKRDIRPVARVFVAALIFATVIAIASAEAAGRSLGLFFGPVLLVTLIAPYFGVAAIGVAWAGIPARASARPARAGVPAHATRHLAVVAGLIIPVFGVWLTYGLVEVSSLLFCAVVLAAWIFALLGLTSLLSRIDLAPVIACAIVVAMAFAWLTWPVWLSRELPMPWGQWIVRCLVPLNPLLAINGVLRERFDMWDRYRIAYQQLTTLNQDVIYTLPRSIWPSVLVNTAIGLSGLILGGRRAQVPPVPSPAEQERSDSAGEDTGGTV